MAELAKVAWKAGKAALGVVDEHCFSDEKESPEYEEADRHLLMFQGKLKNLNKALENVEGDDLDLLYTLEKKAEDSFEKGRKAFDPPAGTREDVKKMLKRIDDCDIELGEARARLKNRALNIFKNRADFIDVLLNKVKKSARALKEMKLKQRKSEINEKCNKMEDNIKEAKKSFSELQEMVKKRGMESKKKEVDFKEKEIETAEELLEEVKSLPQPISRMCVVI